MSISLKDRQLLNPTKFSWKMNEHDENEIWSTKVPGIRKLRHLPSLVVATPSVVGLLGFSLVAFCILFRLDRGGMTGGHYNLDGRQHPGSSQVQKLLSLRGNRGEDVRRVEFLGEEGDECDIFEGDWVWDERYPLYNSEGCKFLDEGFRCSENGRPDWFYTKWRWQPKTCNLPRFEARQVLEKLRDKRVVFVGDSIGRNQWESLLCMLSTGVSDPGSIYEVNGSPITKHKGHLIFKFGEFNCTVEYYRAPFLVLQSRPPSGSPRGVRMTLKLDRMDWSCEKWRDADVLVFNTGHWWNHDKTIRVGCYFQEGAEVKCEMGIDDAYQRAIDTVMRWVQDEVDATKTRVFFRTFSPVHFRGGNWRKGNCNTETLPELGSSLVPARNWRQYKIAARVLSSYPHLANATGLQVLDITRLSSRRKDAHSSLYYLGPRLSVKRQDCSHWCLPGVPDSWNELLLALFLKHRIPGSRNSSVD